ncbi:MAG: enoyl-CoA hydratase [Pseudomonadota bacterium]|nr:enoyl-CoA hydratase [Pseudomonadota bacterium]
MTEHIAVNRAGGICRISIQRPEKKNALTHAMYTIMANAIDQAETDHDTRVVLITGTRDCFTAGNDLNDFLQNPPTGPDSPVIRFLHAISTARKAVVAAVNGPAIGIGTTLLLHCDLAYAGPNARFELPFMKLGLVPEGGSSKLLPELMGYHRACELLMLGETLDARGAAELGLVNAVFEADAYLPRAQAAAERLAALPPAALRKTKALLKAPHLESISQTITKESHMFLEQLRSPEAREAMQAVLERREPDFSKFT